MQKIIFVVLFLLFTIASSSSLDEYLVRGDQALAADEVEQAIAIYQQGVTRSQQQRQQNGEGAKDEQSDVPRLLTEISVYTNLGTALSAMGRNEDAVEAYQQALLVHKNGTSKRTARTGGDDQSTQAQQQESNELAAQSAFFLGMVLQDLEQIADSAQAYQYASQLDPLHWAAQANLGALLHDHHTHPSLNSGRRQHKERLRQALEAYNQAFSVLTGKKEATDAPENPRPVLSQLQYRIGLVLHHDLEQKCALPPGSGNGASSDEAQEVDCKEMATHAFSVAVQYDPDNASAKHMLASITADATVERASNSYVKSLFDDYATNFENSLVQDLKYTGYERLRKGFDRAMEKDSRGRKATTGFDIVVDAGCGTGLVGQEFRNISHHLIGVDLSEAIVEEAVKRRPDLYDEVLVGDVTQHFHEMEGSISLIVAADSYIYFGDLQPLFQAMRAGLKPGGYAAFTLENVSGDSETSLADTKPDWRWQLTASGRFAHRRDYVEQAAERDHFRVQHYEALDGFRFEHGVPVRGHLFVLQKELHQKNQEL